MRHIEQNIIYIAGLVGEGSVKNLVVRFDNRLFLIHTLSPLSYSLVSAEELENPEPTNTLLQSIFATDVESIQSAPRLTHASELLDG